MPPIDAVPRELVAALRWSELDHPPRDLVEIAAALRSEACPWLLDSALEDARLGRFSFAGADPPLVARVVERRVELHVRRAWRPGLEPGFHVFERDPLDVLRALLPHACVADAPPELPFVGGAVGYLGYELDTALPRRRARRDAVSFPDSTLSAFPDSTLSASPDSTLSASPDSTPAAFPDATLLFVDRLIALDHLSGRAYAIGLGLGRCAGEAGRAADELLASARAWLNGRGVSPARASAATRDAPAQLDLARRRELLAQPLPASAECPLGRDGFEAGVGEILEQIAAGNVYEANLTQPISLPYDGDSFALYRALRRASPAPFACWFELPEGAIVSSSPERFLRVGEDGAVESRPIKGTRPRGATAAEDDALARELAASEKDRAENVMIVDLVRNDLGRVCEIGSVAVPELAVVEAYAGVFQLVSTVTGRLRRDRDALDLVRAAFPPGSMTGAPKLAAMALLDRLEPVRRGVYSGAVGWFDVRGGLDLSVVIRTFLVEKGRARVHVGGAVVADSVPADEYEESLVKARALLAAWLRAAER